MKKSLTQARRVNFRKQSSRSKEQQVSREILTFNEKFHRGGVGEGVGVWKGTKLKAY